MKSDEAYPYTNGSTKANSASIDESKEIQSDNAPATNSTGEKQAAEIGASIESANLNDEKVALDGTAELDLVDASNSTIDQLTSDQQANIDATPQLRSVEEEQSNAISDLPPAPSTVLPVIDAQESDLREEIMPAPRDQVDEGKPDKPDVELAADSNTTSDPTQTSTIEVADNSGLLTPSEDNPLRPANVSNLEISSTEDKVDLSMADTLVPAQADAEMSDRPSSPTKVARGREEDNEDGPSAKRAKVDDDADAKPEFAVPAAPTPVTATTSTSAAPEEVSSDKAPPTEYQTKEILKAVRQYKGTVNGRSFKSPVVVLWPTLAAAYAEKVTNPIDLSIIDQRLKDKQYDSIAALKADINLLYDNAVLFNGPENPVTKSAQITRDYLLGKIPGPEPLKQEKKPKKATPIPDAVPARRQSRVVAPPAPSPAPQTFALDPSGTPLIRRDSTKTADGGRPKREIHPPKSKDLVYSARPKKKKFATELKFCDDVLTEIKKQKYTENLPFLVPVDPVALNVPDYFKIIKNPMDLQTVTTRLHSGQYENAKDFETDMRLILKNCFKFNPPGSPVHDIGKKFEQLFETEWARKARYLADHTSNAASPASTMDSEEEESEEEEIVEEPASGAANILAQRLIEEQNKLIEIMSAKNPSDVLVRMQQEMVALIKKEIEKENTKRVKKAKPAKAKRANASTKKKADKKGYRPKHIGQVEKEQISNGIAALVGKELDQAINLLKVDFPNLNLEEELELDIDQFSATTLSRLHDLIARTHPEIVRAVAPPPQRVQKPSKPKKNKPMSKREQEAKIEQLRQLTEKFERQGSASDDAPVVPCERNLLQYLNIC